MDGGLLGSLIGSAVVISGGVAKWLQGRYRALQAEIKELRLAIAAKDAALNAKDDTIVELREQRNELRITANLLDRFLGQLPPKKDR